MNDSHDFLNSFLTEERKKRINTVASERTNYITIVLEDIYHSHNASAIIRICDCFGIQNLHVIENTKRNRVNNQVTQGCTKWVTIKCYNESDNNTEVCLSALKNDGYSIVATTISNNDIYTPETHPIKNKKLAICFGSEELGLSPKALTMADSHLTIPTCGFSQSLNISTAASIILHVIMSRVKKSSIDWNLTPKECDNLIIEWTKNSVKNNEMLLKRFHTENREFI